MSCWRVLELSEQPDGERIPQLLVKPVFNADSYIVQLTCLSNIWSEELDLDGIVDRASEEQSPIEVSKQDTTQLAILLDNVKKSLGKSDDATCRITRNDNDGLTLYTAITLPKPLDTLTWQFHLEKRTSTTLKNELILPLLVSSHIQHERTTSLIFTIKEKDKAITRLVDQFEFSNLDLAAAFPIIGGLKSGRKMIKREQAARHVPALRPFCEDAFKEQTGQLKDSGVTTLGLFQEALSECSLWVPLQLKADDTDLNWWSGIPTRHSKAPSRSKAKKPAPTAKPTKTVANSSDDETEDEFETHENFKTRNVPPMRAKVLESAPPAAPKAHNATDDESTEDDGDLDAPPKSQSQSSSRTPRKPPPRAKSPTLEPSPMRRADPLIVKPKIKGFRIDGKTKTPVVESSPEEQLRATPDVEEVPVKEPPSSQIATEADATPRKARRTFKIGGKGKGRAANDDASQRDVTTSPKTMRTRATQSLTAELLSSPPAPAGAVEEEPSVAPGHEETPEEKANRRRAELKRKTEEAAKKQEHVQCKKKRRF